MEEEHRYIVIGGTPMDGFFYYGPFNTRGEAERWATVEFGITREQRDIGYWISIIEAPEGSVWKEEEQ